MLVDSHLSGESVDDWGMEGLAAALKAMGLGDEPGTSEDELWELGSRDAIREHLLDLADAKLEAKEQEVGEADWATVERLVLLRTIDSLWVEHLTEVDDMRRGIGLRGYAQQDPLNEFRREAFRLYEELRGLIRHQVASSIFRVTVTRQAPHTASGRRPSTAASADAAVGSGRRDRGGPGRHQHLGDAPASTTAAGAAGSGVARDRSPAGSPRIRWPGRCASRRTAVRDPRPAAAPSPGSPRAAPGSGGTTRATAGRA